MKPFDTCLKALLQKLRPEMSIKLQEVENMLTEFQYEAKTNAVMAESFVEYTAKMMVAVVDKWKDVELGRIESATNLAVNESDMVLSEMQTEVDNCLDSLTEAANSNNFSELHNILKQVSEVKFETESPKLPVYSVSHDDLKHSFIEAFKALPVTNSHYESQYPFNVCNSGITAEDISSLNSTLDTDSDTNQPTTENKPNGKEQYVHAAPKQNRHLIKDPSRNNEFRKVVHDARFGRDVLICELDDVILHVDFAKDSHDLIKKDEIIESQQWLSVLLEERKCVHSAISHKRRLIKCHAILQDYMTEIR